MFRWTLGWMLALVILLGGIAPNLATASPGPDKPGSSTVDGGKKKDGKKKKKGKKKGAKKNGKKKGGAKKPPTINT